jgi:hypothetical protein
MEVFITDKMMWLEDSKRHVLDDSDDDSVSSGEEVPIWVRGEQRWVSGITADTTCHDVIQVLLQDEESRVSTPNFKRTLLSSEHINSAIMSEKT